MAGLRHCTGILEGHTSSVSCCVLNKDGTYCMSGSQDKTVRLWNPHRHLLIKTYTAHSYDVAAVAISKDNSQFVSAGGGRRTFVWDVGTGNVIRKYRGHDGRVNTVAYNFDDSVIATGSYDKMVNLWDCRARSQQPVQVLRDAKDSVSSVCMPGEKIVTGSVDGCVRVYDLRMGMLSTDRIGHPVTSVSISGDGNCILANCMDSTLRLSGMDDGELLNVYQGHKNEQYQQGACFTYTDAEVVSGDDGGCLYVWDLVSCDVKAKLSGHKKAVVDVARHSSKLFLVSASLDHTLRTWSDQPSTAAK
eukprot:TRINITY_DN3975_c0_g1_i1.p1 TRINITY_DN3975_c0_g1~~TRINITY_DN3975_c0_g1_i1.p1  ORF type:complete len:304 (-),score=66.57 TRINITY_DN3975_c0_g1_i1:279-1190(-)